MTEDTERVANYTVEEVADILRISRALAYRWVAEGRLPVIKIGRVTRIPKLELEQWMRDSVIVPDVAL